MHPRLLVKLSTLLKLPTGTNSNLAKLIFKPDTTSKICYKRGVKDLPTSNKRILGLQNNLLHNPTQPDG